MVKNANHESDWTTQAGLLNQTNARAIKIDDRAAITDSKIYIMIDKRRPICTQNQQPFQSECLFP